MALKLTKGNQTTNTVYTTTNDTISYQINLNKVNTTLQSINGQITKTTTGSTETIMDETNNVGSFSKYSTNDLNYNLNSSLTTAEKVTIMTDIDDIISQLS